MSSASRPPLPPWVARIVAWMVTERVRARNPDGVGEAVLVLALAGIIVPPLALIGVHRSLSAPAAQGFLLLGLAGFTASLPLVLRRTGSLVFAGNGLALVAFFMSTQSAWYRGGIGSGTLRTIGLVPMLAIFTAGSRDGLVWAVLCALDVLGFAALRLEGFSLTDRVPESARALTDGLVPLATLAVVVTSCLVFRWGRRAALDSLSESEARQRAVIHAVPDLLFLMSKDGVSVRVRHGGSVRSRGARVPPGHRTALPRQALRGGGASPGRREGDGTGSGGRKARGFAPRLGEQLALGSAAGKCAISSRSKAPSM